MKGSSNLGQFTPPGEPQVKPFRLSARVDTSNPGAIEPALRRLIVKGEVRKEGGGFVVEALMEGTSAKDLNRSILSALRRVEKKTRLRAQWTSSCTTERYFDYVLKKTVRA